MLVSVYDEAFKYTAFLVLAFVVTIVVNVYNWWYIKNKVLDENAQKEDKLSQKKVKVLLEEFKKQLARKEKYLKNKKKMDDKHGFGDDEQQFEGGKLEDGLDKLKRKLHITDEQFA
jgi:hypothetical protein